MGLARTTAGARPRDLWAISGSLVLLLLNLLDGTFTTVFLQLGVASEVNPLMRLAYERSPLVFMLLKLALVHAGVLLLWAHRDTRMARIALVSAVVLYTGILLWHLTLLAALAAG